MKFLAALSYALAVAGGSGALLNSAMLAFFVFLGVIFTLLAIERIVQDAVKPVRSAWDWRAEQGADGIAAMFTRKADEVYARGEGLREQYSRLGHEALDRMKDQMP